VPVTRIPTERLDLVATTLAHLDAELAGAGGLSSLLGARVPPDWPPGLYDRDAMRFFHDRLTALGDAAAGWFGWYAIARATGSAPATLVGSGGYMGPPDADGTVEIGYSVVESGRRRGYATEMVRALVARAVATPGVTRVVAEARTDNPASQRVLERCGFRLEGAGRDAEHGRWRFVTSR
jgi:RimJ/RimL family protein N-acetyltransferase